MLNNQYILNHIVRFLQFIIIFFGYILILLSCFPKNKTWN